MNNLKELAESAGISSSYIDKTGAIHYTEDSSRELFLKSMGYEVKTEEDIDREILNLQQKPLLPDVLSFLIMNLLNLRLRETELSICS